MTDMSGGDPAPDETPTSTPEEPTLEQRIAAAVTAQSRRDSGDWDDNGDKQHHDVKVQFQPTRVVLSFYSGGRYRGRFVQMNLPPGAINLLAEWLTQRRRAAAARSVEMMRRGNIEVILATLAKAPGAADNAIHAVAKEMLESYDQMLTEKGDAE